MLHASSWTGMHVLQSKDSTAAISAAQSHDQQGLRLEIVHAPAVMSITRFCHKQATSCPVDLTGAAPGIGRQ